MKNVNLLGFMLEIQNIFVFSYSSSITGVLIENIKFQSYVIFTFMWNFWITIVMVAFKQQKKVKFIQNSPKKGTILFIKPLLNLK